MVSISKKEKVSYHESQRTKRVPEEWSKRPQVDTNLLTKLYIGIVRDTRDPQRMGRILVWIPELTGDSDEPHNWIICTYCSPFAGASYFDTGYYKDKKGNDAVDVLSKRAEKVGRQPPKEKGVYSGRQSYGMFMVPPDVGNEVVVGFINGDPGFAIWMGCIVPQDSNHMIPGIGTNKIFSGENSTGEGPVMEPDLEVEGSNKNKDNPKKRAYTPLQDGLKAQGLDGDKQRGQSTSSVRRESPSEVFGMLTPNGNQFVMDDNPDEGEFIRLRTKGGTQVLINQTTGFIYLNTKSGTTWMELSDCGNVDVYAMASFSVHAENFDINLKAGGDVNIDAGGDINMNAGGDVKIGAAGNSNLVANGGLRLFGGAKASMMSGGELGIGAAGAAGITAGGAFKLQGNGKLFFNCGAGVAGDKADGPSSHGASGAARAPKDKKGSWSAGETYGDNTNFAARVPQHEPWDGHDCGAGSPAEEGTEDKNISKGSTVEGAKKPLDKVGPDGSVYRGTGFDENGNPQYEKMDYCPGALTDVKKMGVSPEGRNMLARFEGLRTHAYNDATGNPTIGVGHLITPQDRASGRFASGSITKEEAMQLLQEDEHKHASYVQNCIQQPLTQAQYDACVSLAYNMGGAGFCKSQVARQINAGNYDAVPNAFMRYNTSKGQVLAGLTNRRKEEAANFAKAPKECEPKSGSTDATGSNEQQ